MRQVPELIGKDVVPTMAMCEASESGNIIGERNRRERTLPYHDWMDKLHGNVLSLCTTSAIAKGDLFPPW